MTFYEHIKEFAGKPVFEWDPEKGVADPDASVFKIGVRYRRNASEVWIDKFAAFLEHPASAQATGLVVGLWTDTFSRTDNEAEQVVEALVAARERLRSVTAIFFGDIISEEWEVSWIRQTDVSPLLAAYPALEHFAVRGGNGLSLGTPRLPSLRSLVVESGGLDAQVVHEVSTADLPALEHLELWLGTDEYGATVAVEDLEPILSGRLFPNLKYLGLRDSDIADEIAAALATAPILERIETLDLSMGTLGDEGMEALLASPHLNRLKKLDIHFHYCSEEMLERLDALETLVDAGDPQEEDDDYRYVAVGE